MPISRFLTRLIRILFPTFLRKKLYSVAFFREGSDAVVISCFVSEGRNIYSLKFPNRSAAVEYLSVQDLIRFWNKLKEFQSYIDNTDFRNEKIISVKIRFLTELDQFILTKTHVYFSDNLISKFEKNKKLSVLVELYVIDATRNRSRSPRILVNCYDFDSPSQYICNYTQPVELISDALAKLDKMFEIDDYLRQEKDNSENEGNYSTFKSPAR